MSLEILTRSKCEGCKGIGAAPDSTGAQPKACSNCDGTGWQQKWVPANIFYGIGSVSAPSGFGQATDENRKEQKPADAPNGKPTARDI